MVQMFLSKKRVPSCTEPAGDSGDAFQQLSERGECGRREIQPQSFNSFPSICLEICLCVTPVSAVPQGGAAQ